MKGGDNTFIAQRRRRQTERFTHLRFAGSCGAQHHEKGLFGRRTRHGEITCEKTRIAVHENEWHDEEVGLMKRE